MNWTNGTSNVPFATGGLYPMTSAMLRRSFTPANGSWPRCTWPRIVSALNRGEQVYVSVLGGSFTFGTDCVGVSSCAWPRHIEPWIRRVRPYWRITVHNNAQSGVSAENWASSFIEDADVYIVDTGVNDFGGRGDGLRSLLSRLMTTKFSNATGVCRRPAVLYLQPYRTCGHLRDHCTSYCPEAEMSQSADNSSYFWCNSFWGEGDVNVHSAVDFFGLPVASFRDAIWPVQNDPPPDFPLFWNGLAEYSINHPYGVTHQLYADMVKYALSRLLFISGAQLQHDIEMYNSTGADVQPVDELCALRANQSTVFRMHKDDPTNFKPMLIEGNWSFSADRPGKFGWILDSR